MSEITADNVLNATKKRENSCKITAKFVLIVQHKSVIETVEMVE